MHAECLIIDFVVLIANVNIKNNGAAIRTTNSVRFAYDTAAATCHTHTRGSEGEIAAHMVWVWTLDRDWDSIRTSW